MSERETPPSKSNFTAKIQRVCQAAQFVCENARVGPVHLSEGILFALAISVCVSLSLSACNLYSSSDRKSFNSNANTSASAPPKTSGNTSAKAADASLPNSTAGTNGSLRLSLSRRTHCTQVENVAPLLLRGIDIVHSAEAWNVESDDRNQTNRFVWARRSENSAGVLCFIEPLSDYELQHTLTRLPILASHLSADLP